MRIVIKLTAMENNKQLLGISSRLKQFFLLLYFFFFFHIHRQFKLICLDISNYHRKFEMLYENALSTCALNSQRFLNNFYATVALTVFVNVAVETGTAFTTIGACFTTVISGTVTV